MLNSLIILPSCCFGYFLNNNMILFTRGAPRNNILWTYIIHTDSHIEQLSEHRTHTQIFFINADHFILF